MTDTRTLSTPPVGGLRAAVDDIVTMLWRDLIRTARQPEMLVFAVVNAAAFRSATTTGGGRWVPGLGVLGCAGSLVALLQRSVARDPVGLIVLAALIASALATEHFVLRRRRRAGSS